MLTATQLVRPGLSVAPEDNYGYAGDDACMRRKCNTLCKTVSGHLPRKSFYRALESDVQQGRDVESTRLSGKRVLSPMHKQF
eukprot:2741609-Amphidinium_carterae.1